MRSIVKKNANILIIFLFMMLAIANAWLIIHQHALAIGSDMPFHWQELLELIKSKHLFPYYALNSFSYSGSAVLTMYPYLFLYPIVWVFNHVHSVTLTMYIVFIFNTFISLIIDYFGSLSLVKGHKTVSFLFSIMYSLSSVFIIDTFITADLGVLYTIIFIPLVIFGFISWLRDGKWLMLAIGVSLMVYCNVLSAMIVPVLLIIWLIISFQFINLTKLFNLIKAVVVSLLVTAAFWVPALKILIYNKLSIPTTKFFMENSIKSQGFREMLTNAIHPTLGVKFALYDHYVITIYALIGIVCGILFYKALTPLLRRSYLFSLVTLFICSDHFPWAKTLNLFPFIKTLQFTGRMFIFPLMILTFILAYCIGFVISHLKPIRIPVILVMILLVLGVQVIAQKSAIHQPFAPVNNAILNPYNKSYNHKMWDYYPQSAVMVHNNISAHQGTYSVNGRRQMIKVNPLGQGRFRIHNHTGKVIKRLTLPFLDYHHVRYQSLVNRKRVVNHPNQNQLMTINNVRPGRSVLSVKPASNNLYVWITILGVIICGIELVLRSIKKIHQE